MRTIALPRTSGHCTSANHLLFGKYHLNLLICLFIEADLSRLPTTEGVSAHVVGGAPLRSNDTAPHSGFDLVTTPVSARKDKTLRDPLSSL
jgi:hypothetical protein